jgi:hypothetical protein
MTGDVPAPLVSAFWRELFAEAPDLRTRRGFLRRVAEGAVGPLPPADGYEAVPSSRGETAPVPLSDGVALALAVVGQFDGPVEDGRSDPTPAAGGLSGRVVARELLRRVGRRLPGGRR